MANVHRLWVLSSMVLASCQAGAPVAPPATYHTQSVVAAVTSDADRAFLTAAAAGNQAEVTLGNVAIAHCQTAGCRGVGERLVKDHTKGLKMVRTLASQLGVPLSNDACVSLVPLAEQLAKLNGVEFDRTYLLAMEDDHVKDIAKFKAEAEKADDPRVRDFARGMLPTLEAHLALVKAAMAAL